MFNLQDGLIVNVVEDGPVDLTRLQGNPVQHRHPKLCLDRLLYLHSCTTGRQTCEQGDRLSIHVRLMLKSELKVYRCVQMEGKVNFPFCLSVFISRLTV